MDDPENALSELMRITKPGGEVLIFIYSDAYAGRENFNRFVKHIPDDAKHALIEGTSDFLDAWREVDKFYADLLSQNVFMSVKQSREWQIFQWYDGVTPWYHSLLNDLVNSSSQHLDRAKLSSPGCHRFWVA
jgi:ubiquinone/menaquinone biosynthesis C-methylase UbiE